MSYVRKSFDFKSCKISLPKTQTINKNTNHKVFVRIRKKKTACESERDLSKSLSRRPERTGRIQVQMSKVTTSILLVIILITSAATCIDRNTCLNSLHQNKNKFIPLQRTRLYLLHDQPFSPLQKPLL